jgi:hypothetical protein
MREQPEYRPWRDSTNLIATAIYTRGLWTALFLWRALSVRPFKTRAVEWGVDEAELRRHLRASMKILLPLTVAEVVVYWLSLRLLPNLAGFLFLLLVALQWTVLPWIAARRLLAHRSAPLEHGLDTVSLVASDEHCPIPDLGYLLREARFAVDVTSAEPQKSAEDLRAALYDGVEKKFADLGTSGVQSQRVRVVATEEAQPSKRAAAESVIDNLSITGNGGSTRLLIFGQRPGSDGLAAVEFSVRMIKCHLSLDVRTRWLPPLRRRFNRLACLPLQKTWWRGVAVPCLLAFALLLLWSFLQILSGRWIEHAGLIGPTGVAPAALLLGQSAPTTDTGASTTAPVEQPVTDTTLTDSATTTEPTTTSSSPSTDADALREMAGLPNQAPDSGSSVLSQAMALLAMIIPFRFAGIVRLVAIVTFVPLLGFALIILARLIRLVRGLLYAATGTVLDVAAPRCYRLRAAELTLGDEGSLRSGLAYLQVMEQALIDTVITILQDLNIDTRSIREEARVMINEGIYMTGGSLQASNVVVGTLAKLQARHRAKVARTGRVTFGQAFQSKKNAA